VPPYNSQLQFINLHTEVYDFVRVYLRVATAYIPICCGVATITQKRVQWLNYSDRGVGSQNKVTIVREYKYEQRVVKIATSFCFFFFFFFFRLSAQGQVLSTKMFFGTVPSLLGFGMYIHRLSSSSSLEFYILVFCFASFLLFVLQEYLLTVYHLASHDLSTLLDVL